jgi:hypothetical protein
MEQASIKTVEKYLVTLPDSALEQVVTFVSYLNYLQNIDCEYPYPDEQRAIDQYRKMPDVALDWETVKTSI